jgi:hypothetical protein
MDAKMLHGTTTETEIASELHIQICEPRRNCPLRSSKSPLAIFQSTDQQRTASLARFGLFQAVRPDSTRRSGVASDPRDVFGFTPEIPWTGLYRLAK